MRLNPQSTSVRQQMNALELAEAPGNVSEVCLAQGLPAPFRARPHRSAFIATQFLSQASTDAVPHHMETRA